VITLRSYTGIKDITDKNAELLK